MDSKEKVDPVFSVIMPSYNRASFLHRSISSVLNQSFSSWELIVIDDASTDSTPEVLTQFTDQRIRVFRNAVNLERSASRNKAILLAQGKYICFLDSDDYYLPDHLTVLSRFINEHHNILALYHTSIAVVDAHGSMIRDIEFSYSKDVTLTQQILTVNIQPNAVAISRDILKEFTFDTSLNVNEDVYLFALIASKYPVLYSNVVTVAWVLHGDNTSNQIRNYLKPQLHAYRRMLKNPAIKSRLSTEFIKNRYFELYTQLVYFHAVQKDRLKALGYFLNGFCIRPFHSGNKTNLLNIVYNLPGGGMLRKLVLESKKS